MREGRKEKGRGGGKEREEGEEEEEKRGRRGEEGGGGGDQDIITPTLLHPEGHYLIHSLQPTNETSKAQTLHSHGAVGTSNHRTASTHKIS